MNVFHKYMKIKVIYCNINEKLNQLTMVLSQKVHIVSVDGHGFQREA